MRDIVFRHTALINQTDMGFQRSVLNRIPWNERLVGIKGSRGIGKTTLVLQYIKQTYQLNPKALYASLDDPYFYSHRLIDFADDFVAMGGQHLFLDEVHKYPEWAVELKKIYDYHPGLKVVFTGSSLLEILNSRADLSRRALVYSMQGLSFREYLEFRHGIKWDSFSLNEILTHHVDIALQLAKEVKPLKYFSDYLRVGYFPFYNENEEFYFKRIQEIINMIVDLELPLLRKVEVSKVPKIKKLLYILSQNVPFKPNITTLAGNIEISRNSLLEYLNALIDAHVLMGIHKDSVGIGVLQKPDKLFLENTNYSFALSQQTPNTGSLRETFFLNQVLASHPVNYPQQGDFIVDNQFTFEVGGKNKDFTQIAALKNSYIAADNIEYGTGNKIPLWLFGFLY